MRKLAGNLKRVQTEKKVKNHNKELSVNEES